MMENRFPSTISLNNDTSINGEEEELYSITYDTSTEFQDTSKISSLIPSKGTSEETIQLSFEVEIADSLKHIIASPEIHQSELLDVTIVRPNELNCIKNFRESQITCKPNTVKSLIATMERERHEKKKLLDECKRKVASSKMKPILEIHEAPSDSSSSQELIAKISHKHHRQKQHKEPPGVCRNNIAVMSAPTKAEHRNERRSENKTKKIYATSSINMLKPLVGEVRQSLRNLEARIVQAGDQKPFLHGKNYNDQSSCSVSTYSASNIKHDKKHHHVNDGKPQQIYATANTYNKLRNLLACQQEKHGHNSDKPCMCQHCGMVGLLVESQKRPIFDHPQKRTDTIREEHAGKAIEVTRSRYSVFDQNAVRMLREINCRLDKLELRMAAQEHRAVRKSYFRRIISRLISNQVDDVEYEMKDLKNTYTQYSRASYERLVNSKIKSEYRDKHRTGRTNPKENDMFCVCPISVKSDNPENCSRSEQTTDKRTKTVTNRAVSAINDFFTKFGSDKDIAGLEKDEEMREKSFWRWGEEIIKPGFDLKTKIMTLLEEQFPYIMGKKDSEVKSCTTKTPSVPKIKTFRNNATSAGDLFEAPAPYEDKEGQENPKYGNSKTLKKVLDLMSERIYNDHVKPTVEAIKEKQQTVNNENNKQITSIKAAMDKAINTSSRKIPNATINHELEPCNGEALRNIPQSPGLPPSCGNTLVPESGKNSKYSKIAKSGIPVRVANTSFTVSTATKMTRVQHDDQQSRIPFPDIELSKSITESTSTKETEKSYNYIKTPHRQKLKPSQRKHETTDSSDVRITYKSSKVARWNEESSASLPEEIQQLMFAKNCPADSGKYEKRITNNQEEKRRIADKLSVADKLAFLTNMTSAEIGKPQLWNTIWKQAKNHCKSSADTIIIQVPTKSHSKNKPEMTEVEFTIGDIQKLISSTKGNKDVNKECKNIETVDSFLLIRSKKILDEVHKRVGATLNKAS